MPPTRGGRSAPPSRASGASRGPGAGYYLSPAEKGGEPPGIWTGKGVADLGLRPGGSSTVQSSSRSTGSHLDPRDPAGQARLGRAPQRFRSAEEIYAALLAAEPEATAERRAQLMIEAKSQVRTPDLYFDATFSVSKSITLLHASALANAAAAASAATGGGPSTGSRSPTDIWARIMAGNRAALDYLQREAGHTRSGYHPGGRWEDAHEWVIASFRQHTSRDGDPQLHVHNLILNRVRRGARRRLADAGLPGAVRAPGRRVGDRHAGDGVRADPPVRRRLGAAPTATAARSRASARR